MNKKISLFVMPLLSLAILASCNSKPSSQKYNVRVVNSGGQLLTGVSINPDKTIPGKEYKGIITVDTTKTGGKVLPASAKKVESGGESVTSFNYTRADDFKSADFSLPARLNFGNIVITVALIDPPLIEF